MVTIWLRVLGLEATGSVKARRGATGIGAIRIGWSLKTVLNEVMVDVLDINVKTNCKYIFIFRILPLFSTRGGQAEGCARLA